MSDVDGVELAVFLFLFLLVTVLGFLASRWRRADSMDSLDEWGLGGRGFGTFISWFLIGGDIYTAYTFIAVPATLYAGSRGRVLRGALHDRALPDHLHLPAAVLVGLAPARLRHAGRLRARPLRLQAAGARGGRHRPRWRRCPTSRCSWSASRWCSRPWASAAARRVVPGAGRPAADRVRGARGVHVRLGAARAGADRVRQGHPDLRGDHRRGDLPADPARRLGLHLQRRRGLVHAVQQGQRGRHRRRHRRGQGRSSRRPRRSGPTPRWPWAPPSRCSCTRTR